MFVDLKAAGSEFSSILGRAESSGVSLVEVESFSWPLDVLNESFLHGVRCLCDLAMLLTASQLLNPFNCKKSVTVDFTGERRIFIMT